MSRPSPPGVTSLRLGVEWQGLLGAVQPAGEAPSVGGNAIESASCTTRTSAVVSFFDIPRSASLDCAADLLISSVRYSPRRANTQPSSTGTAHPPTIFVSGYSRVKWSTASSMWACRSALPSESRTNATTSAPARRASTISPPTFCRSLGVGPRARNFGIRHHRSAPITCQPSERTRRRRESTTPGASFR